MSFDPSISVAARREEERRSRLQLREPLQPKQPTFGNPVKVEIQDEISNRIKNLFSQEDIFGTQKGHFRRREYHQVPKEVEDTSERTVNYTKNRVTEVTINLTFYAQNVDEEPKLHELMQKLNKEFSTNPSLIGSYTPKKGDLCAALYPINKLWYRAKIDKLQDGQISVTYVDFGIKAITTAANLASLPSTYALPPFAHEYALAFIKPPSNTTYAWYARSAFFELVDKRELLLNVEYNSGLSHVTLLSSEEKKDIGKELILKGFVVIDPKNEKKFQKIMSEYVSAQETAKKNRVNRSTTAMIYPTQYYYVQPYMYGATTTVAVPMTYAMAPCHPHYGNQNNLGTPVSQHNEPVNYSLMGDVFPYFGCLMNSVVDDKKS